MDGEDVSKNLTEFIIAWNKLLKSLRQKGEESDRSNADVELPSLKYTIAHHKYVEPCLEKLERAMETESLKKALGNSAFKEEMRVCSFVVQHNYVEVSSLVKVYKIGEELNIEEQIKESLYNGKITENLLEAIDEENKEKAFALHEPLIKLKVGVEKSEEGLKSSIPFEPAIHPFNSKLYWMKSYKKEELNKLLKEMEVVSSKIQLLNAKRQLNSFSEEEEKEFEDLQHKYLELRNKINDLFA